MVLYFFLKNISNLVDPSNGKCDETCNRCENNQCVLCFSNFVLQNGECVKCPNSSQFVDDFNTCVDCPDHCLSCKHSESCLVCDSGFFLDLTTLKCVSCVDNCIECSKLDYCDVCKKNYKTNVNNGKCLKTKTDQLETDKIKVTETTTTSQDSDSLEIFYETNSKPNPIIDNCLTTNKSGNCILCKPGYFFENNKCSPCVDGCLKCLDSTNTCLECAFSYTLVEVSQTCVKSKVIFLTLQAYQTLSKERTRKYSKRV